MIAISATSHVSTSHPTSSPTTCPDRTTGRRNIASAERLRGALLCGVTWQPNPCNSTRYASASPVLASEHVAWGPFDHPSPKLHSGMASNVTQSTLRESTHLNRSVNSNAAAVAMAEAAAVPPSHDMCTPYRSTAEVV